MDMATNDNNIENKIIETAQQLFVKNGFTDTKPFLETSYFLWLPKFKGLWCRTNPYPNG